MNLHLLRQLFDRIWNEKDVRWVIILSFLLPLVVLPGTSDPYGSVKLDLFYLLTGLALVSGLPRSTYLFFLNKHIRIFIYGLLLFLLCALISTIFSLDFIYSLRGYDFRYIHSLLFYFVWGAFIVRLSILPAKSFKWIIGTLLFSALIVALQSYLDVIAGLRTGMLYTWITVRPIGLLGNANFSSFFVSVLFIFCFWIEKYVPKTYKLLWILCSLVIFGSLLLFSSRGNLLGAVLGILLYIFIYLYRQRYKISLKKVFILFTSSLLLVFILFQIGIVWRTNSFSSNISFLDSNILNRVNLYDIAIEGFKTKPITGYGLGNYGYVYQSWVKSHGFVDTAMNDDPHNFLLNLLVTGGVGLFTGFILMMFGSLKLLWIKSKEEENGHLYLVAFISLIVWIINAQFNPIEVSGMLVLAILFGLSLSGNIQDGIGIKSAKLKVFGIVSLIIATSFILGDLCLNLGLLSYNNQNVALANTYLKIGNYISPGTRVISSLYTMTQIQADPNSFDMAVSKFRRSHPQYGETNYWLGNFYMNKYLATNDSKYLDQSINYFKEAALDAPFSDSSVKYYAQSLIEKGSYDEAALVTKQWVTKKPENFDAWNVLAKVYQRQKKYTQMEWALKQSYKADPNQEYIAKVLRQFKTHSKPEQVEYYIVNKVGRF